VDFVLALHSHLPYVLNHGRWPHGSDWLCEAAIDTYLPLLEQLRGLADRGIPAPVTIGFTPVLANQLAHPRFERELEAFFDQRLAACGDAATSLAATGEASLAPLARFWESRFRHLRTLYQAIDRDILAAFRRLEDSGHLEIIGSAATHGYLPLLARDESVRLQLAVGRHEHRRLFGRAPAGCWLPECAYRPRLDGRAGIEEHLAAFGFRYFFTDAHLAWAGAPLGAYGDVPLGTERFDVERHDRESVVSGQVVRSPYRGYRVASTPAGTTVATLVRDPRSSMQVWSRHHGYPGDEWYLEFHKIRWPGGLKLWRVTGPNVDLGAKYGYEPAAARERATSHARHFAHLVAGIAAQPGANGAGVVVAPFDTELFGHWWFEGVDFLADVYDELRHQPSVHPTTAARHVKEHPPRTVVRLGTGSWGVNGDDSMWINEGTAWTWRRLRALEESFWSAAPAALASPGARHVLAQAARELLLAQASDWQFMISTGAVVDYAERRFTLHCDDAERLLGALRSDAAGADALADELGRRDELFPDVLDSLAEVLGV
jgi:1,4-alpha-glucan branching enzyme